MTSANLDGRLRMLVVDDHTDCADSLQILLELGGHNARAAYAAAAALDLALNFNPHVVFSDIQMPAMHGAEFARRLRQVPGLEDVVVIATSATSRDDPRLEGYDGLFDDWLVKPYGLAELESMLTRFAPRLLRRR